MERDGAFCCQSSATDRETGEAVEEEEDNEDGLMIDAHQGRKEGRAEHRREVGVENPK